MLSLRQVYIIGFVLTLVIVVMLAGYAVYEPQRMAAAAQRLTSEKIAAGSEVFASNCATCHGKNGEGVSGVAPTLNSKGFLSAVDNEFIAKTISNGRPGTAMPAWAEENGGPLRSDQIDDIVAFIRSWEATAPTTSEAAAPAPTAGTGSVKESGQVTTTTSQANAANVQMGQQLFNSQGCIGCHAIDGKGGSVGPDLTKVGSRRDADWLTQWLKNPKAPMPPSTLGDSDLKDLVGYLSSLK